MTGSLAEAVQARLAEARRRLAEQGEAALTPAPEARHEPFPLSEIQEAYWIGRQDAVELGDTPCFIYVELDAGPLDVARLGRAWAALVARHGMLRVEVLADGRQRVRPTAPDAPLACHDLPERGAAAARAAIREAMVARIVAGGAWPLHELRVTRCGGAARIHVCLDVQVGDGASLRILLDELALLYAEPAAALPPIGLSYRDYLLALAERRVRQPPEAARRHWEARLDELPERPKLPVRELRCGTAVRFARRMHRLDVARWTAVKARARAEGLTPTGVLLAAFAEVLAAWSEEPRFTLTLTLFDRRPLHPDVGRLVGDFSSSLLLACEVRRGAGFVQLARRLHARLLQDLDHRDHSGVRVVRELLRRSGSAPRALMPVVFTSHLEEPPWTAPWRLADGVSQTPQVWLDHGVHEDREGNLVVHWDALEAVFLPGVLDAMLSAFLARLEALGTDPAAWDRPRPPARPLATPDPAAPGPAAAAPGTLPIWPAGDGPAIAAADAVLSAAELRRQAAGIAAALTARRVRRGDVVAVAMARGATAVAAQCGILMRGAAFLPVEPGLPLARAEALLADAGVACVATGPGTPAAIAARPDALDLRDLPSGPPGPAVAGQRDLAYAIYTSGSTGRPKGVLVEHAAAANTILDINARFGVGPGDCALWVSAMGFDLSVYDVFGPLAAGARLAIPPEEGARDPATWLACMAQHRVTIWNSAPQLMEMLLAHLESSGAAAPAGLRLVLLSGDWIAVTLPERIRRHFGAAVRVVSLGGATEAGIWSILHEVEAADPAWRSIPYGRAMSSQSVDVRDAALMPVPDWVAGELVIGGLGLARGYHADPAATAQRFVPCPLGGARLYRTGDLARRRDDGVIELLGRMDRQVKILGHRIEPGEVEATLLADARLAAAVAVPYRGRLAAYVVPRAGEAPDPEALRRAAAERLPAAMVPRWIVPLAALPVSANGKLDRAALPPPAETPAGHAPPGAAEARLAALWEEVLGTPPASVWQDFFAAGGDSLLALRLQARIREVFAVALPLRALFEAPNLADLALAVDAATAAPAAEEEAWRPDSAARFEPFPLTDVQQAYWVGREDGFELGNVAAYAYAEFEAPAIDLARLGLAVDRLVARHDMLRAVFLPDGRQRVLDRVPPCRIAADDLRACPEEERATRLAATRAALSHRRLDPAEWPLFVIRASLLPSAVRLHVGVDLLIADAWSLALLREELARLMADPSAALAPLGVTFRDAVLHGRSAAQEAERRRAEAFWRDRLPLLPPAPALPLRADPGAIAAPRYERRSGRLAPAPWRRLCEAAARRGLTPSAALAATFGEVLGATTGQRSLTLNVSLFHRRSPHPYLDRVVGDFTSIMLVPVEADALRPLAARAAAVQRALQDGLDHAAWSGVRLLRARARAGLGGMPVVFTSTLGLRRPAPEGGWTQVWGVSQTPQVWLDHQVSEDPDGALRWHWDVVEALFPPGLIDALSAAYADRLLALAGEDAAWEACGRALPAPQAAALAGVALEVHDRNAVARLHRARRSVRRFSAAPVPLERLARLLTALMAIDEGGAIPKYRYGSAGTLYPVRAYLLTRPGGVQGLPPGLHRYDPLRHRLDPVGEVPLDDLAESGRAAFALCLVAARHVIEPVYGARGLDFCRIEAGLMAQALETEAAAAGLGLCQLGGFPVERIARLLPPGEEPVHALWGGLPAGPLPAPATTPAPAPAAAADAARTADAHPAPPEAPFAPEGSEARLAAAWAETLGLRDVPPDVSFFDLGGDSVQLVRLRNRLAAETGREVPLRLLLGAPTLREQARQLAAPDPLVEARARGETRRAARDRPLGRPR